jgi:hypothetical protein
VRASEAAARFSEDISASRSISRRGSVGAHAQPRVRALQVIEVVDVDRDRLVHRQLALERDDRRHQLRERSDRRDVVGTLGVDRPMGRCVDDDGVDRGELELAGSRESTSAAAAALAVK